MKEKKLGRGLDFLLGEATAPKAEDLAHIDLGQLASNPYQPRTELSGEEIDALAASISKDGLLQPIVARKRDAGYEIVAGERRVRACKSLGWSTIPATVVDVSDKDMLLVALAENILRKDLNPIERARAFEQVQKQFSVTQEELGRRIGLDRSTIANLIRILELPPEIREHVSRGTVSMGHARALLSVQDRAVQKALCEQIIRDGSSVRELERAVRRLSRPRKTNAMVISADIIGELEVRIQSRLGTKVRIMHGKRKGMIIIEYYGNDDLDRLVEQIAPQGYPESAIHASQGV